MRSLLLVFSTAFAIVGAAGSAIAQSNFESALQESRYPTGLAEGICYAKTDAPNTFDLSRLCGSVAAPTSTGGSYSGGYGGSSSRTYSGGGSSGVCNTPDDIARDGSRCGGRAASERPGGRLGGSYTPSYGSSSYTPSYRGSTGGSVYVSPYTRSNGTSVGGYWRRR